MKTIKLTQGKVALVDDADFCKIAKYKWYARKTKRNFYAETHTSTTEPRSSIQMHRLLVKTKAKEQIDHKDGNGLNNQRKNLRIANAQQNQANRRKYNGTSNYKGVYHRSNKWYASIQINGQKIYLGSYTNELSAAIRYNIAAIKYFKNFAKLN